MLKYINRRNIILLANIQDHNYYREYFYKHVGNIQYLNITFSAWGIYWIVSVWGKARKTGIGKWWIEFFYEKYVFCLFRSTSLIWEVWRSIATFQKAKIKIQENQILHFFQPNLRWIECILMIFVIAYRHDICQIFYISVFSIIWKFTRRTCIFATC